MKKRVFRVADLSRVSLAEQWAYTIDLLRLANDGVDGAARIATLTLERYFDRIDEEQMT